ncbi:MAG: hypothetical protein ACFNO7_06200 [Bacteroides sp.]
MAEIIADKIILTSTEDGLELLGNLYYQGFDKIIIHEKNIEAIAQIVVTLQFSFWALFLHLDEQISL